MRSSTARRVTARRALVTIGAAVLTVPFIATSAFSAPSGARAAIAGTVPSWAKSSAAVGSPAASTQVSFHVVLQLRDAAGAAKLAQAVSSPKSSSYGHYLTPVAFNAKYAPTASSVAKVESFLKSSGISVTGVAAGNRWVEAKGTVAQINAAFGTTLKNYRFKGKTLRGASSALTMPTSVSGLVMGFSGVSQSLAAPAGATPVNDNGTTPSDLLPPFANCSAYWDQYEQTMPLAYGKTSFPTPGCGYGPADIRAAYGLQKAENKGDTGKGVTVAIVDAYASPTALADVNYISDAWGEPEMTPGQYTETTFGPFNDDDICGGQQGWNIEESLDIDSVHGVAPGANIHYIGAQNCDTGLDDAMNYIVQNHAADLVSDSWSNLGEDGLGDEVSIEHSIFLQGALEGIGFYFSTGDDGDNVELGGLSSPEPDYPASDTLATAVGGTTLAVNSDGSYKFETVWGPKLDRVNFATSPSSYSMPLPGDMLVDIGGGNLLSDGGAGGGVSALFTQPWYQAGIVPNKLAKLNGKTAMRVIPDVSMDADPETGLIIDYAGGFYQYGGTSLSCPLMAGLQAVASQNRIFPIGFANPLLYTLSQTGVAFHDITNPKAPIGMASQSGKTLFTLGLDSSLTMAKGYDDATGIGSPNGSWFLLGEAILP
jgi:subtilase family serine protease